VAQRRAQFVRGCSHEVFAGIECPARASFELRERERRAQRRPIRKPNSSMASPEATLDPSDANDNIRVSGPEIASA